MNHKHTLFDCFMNTLVIGGVWVANAGCAALWLVIAFMALHKGAWGMAAVFVAIEVIWVAAFVNFVRGGDRGRVGL